MLAHEEGTLRPMASRALLALLALLKAIVLALLAILTALLEALHIAFVALRAGAVWIVRAVCVGAVVLAIAAAWPMCWQGYGGDVPALLPASAVVLLPVTAAVLAHSGYGGLLVAGAVTFVAGNVIAELPAPGRALLAILPIGAAVMHSLTKGQSHEQPNE